jgi:membrane fusion protein, adhesin transport system
VNTKYDFRVNQDVTIRDFVKRIGVITSVILLILFSMLFLPWQQTVNGNGTLIAFHPTQRAYEIKATYAGFVNEYHVAENQHVKKGDPLCSIIDQDSEYESRLKQKLYSVEKELEAVAQRVESLQNEKEQIQKFRSNGLKLFEGRLEQSFTKQKSLQEQLRASNSALETLLKRLERAEELYALGLESKQELENIQNIFVDVKAKYEQSQNGLEYEKQNYQNMVREKEQFLNAQNARLEQNAQNITRAKGDVESLERTRVDLQTQNERYAGRVMRAQRDGVVMRIYQSDKNRLIAQGEKLFHFVPDATQRAVLLKISDFHMPLLKKNLPVRIKFNGWPALQISGWPKIAFGTFGGYIHTLEPISHEQGFYYAYIFEDEKEPWPPSDVLRYGSQATAWVRLESVPIWYQIWRHINAMPPNMPSER